MYMRFSFTSVDSFFAISCKAQDSLHFTRTVTNNGEVQQRTDKAKTVDTVGEALH